MDDAMLKTEANKRRAALEAVRTLIAYIGDNPDREGLLGTPERVLRAWENDWGRGYYDIDPRALSIFAGEGCDQLVVINDIKFFSHCEHHLTPFFGTASVGYFPEKGIIGLSKLARVVDHFARRLQVQEYLTNEIADFLQAHVSTIGVGVILRATHMCMVSRGVLQPNAVTLTSALRGDLRDDDKARHEFLRLAGV